MTDEIVNDWLVNGWSQTQEDKPMTYETFPDAEPLTPEEYAELNADQEWAHLITEIDGKFYNDEDLWHCVECSEPFIETASINDDGHCELCAQDLIDEATHQRQERPW